MLKEILSNHRFILGSGSPRRQKFLEDLGIPFIKILKPIEEVFPQELSHKEIPEHLAKLKAEPFLNDLIPGDILFTCDTIVWYNNKALGKPKTQIEAKTILGQLSGKCHEVISSICLTTQETQTTQSSITKVYFKSLSNYEIDYYVNKFKPFDKAGAYGIQEWIGLVAIEKIEGSYENVVGLPTHLLYKTLIDIINK